MIDQKVNELFFVGVILFAVTVMVIVVLSLVTKPIPKEELAGLTWATIGNKKQADKRQANEAIDECKYTWLCKVFWKFKITEI